MTKIYKIKHLYKYEDTWNDLVNFDNSTPFQSYEWLNFIIKEHNKNPINIITTKAYFAIYEGEDAKIIFPFYVKKHGSQRGVFLLGTGGKSDYLDIVCSPDATSIMFENMLKKIKLKFNIDAFVFPLIRNKSNVWSLLKDLNFKLNISENECALISLPPMENDYLSSLSKKTRQNIRTAYNRLQIDEKKIEFKIFERNQINKKLMNEISTIYETRSSYKNRNVKRNILQKIKDKISDGYDVYEDSLMKSDVSKLVAFYIDGEISSYLIMLFDKNQNIYVPRLSINNVYHKYSPGVLLLQNLIEYFYKKFEYPYPFIDLTNGGERYKYSLGAEKHTTKTVVLKI